MNLVWVICLFFTHFFNVESQLNMMCKRWSTRPHPSDSSRFYFCSPIAGDFVISKCQNGYYYNASQSKCVAFTSEISAESSVESNEISNLLPRMCGRRKFSTRRRRSENKIIGGTNVDIKYFPWQVNLRSRGNIFCGGAIITDSHILTAAHCMKDFSSSRILVRVGDTNVLTRESTELVYKIKAKYIHEDYTGKKASPDDIAVLLLDHKLNFDSMGVQPICLPRYRSHVKNESCVVSGWGITENGKESDALKAAIVPTYTHQQCVKYFDSGKITEGMMCAGKEGKDTCQGDSGGPLVCANDGVFTLHGITSWGDGCGSKKPGVYTQVSHYIKWIVSKLKQSYSSPDWSSDVGSSDELTISVSGDPKEYEDVDIVE